MSTVKTGWLKNNNGEKFAPKTLMSQVMTNEGIALESQLSVDLNATLEAAKEYTDTMTSNAASTAVVDNKISTHNTSASSHADIRELVSELSTKVINFLDVDDATTDQLSEVLTLINNNKGTLDSITSNKVNVSDIVDNLTTSNASKVLSAKQGVALKALIDALQAALDGKVNTSDIVDNLTTSSTTKPLSAKQGMVLHNILEILLSDMDSLKTLENHTHPIDYALNISSKNPVENQAITNWLANNVKNYALSLDYNTGNIYLNDSLTQSIAGGMDDGSSSGNDVCVSSISNYPIAPKWEYIQDIPSASTSVEGIVKLTNSTSSTSTTTAATPNSVKSAYDLANTAKTKADSAYSLAESKVDSLSDLGVTASATELNYVKGVTSAIQTQLDSKAAASNLTTHTGNADIHFTAAERTKLAGIDAGANKITIDTALSTTSTNPVQNKVVNSAITTLTSSVTTNANSISAHNTAIANLQEAIGEIQDITSEDIQNLFK